MITFTAKCDHPDCSARGPHAETRQGAQEAAAAAGWQRWLDGSDELRDLCPDHHQAPLETPRRRRTTP